MTQDDITIISQWIEALKAPFPPDAVSWRVGSTTQDKKKGLALAYIDARDVMDRLDETVGPENWSDAYAWIGDRILCTLSIRVGENGDWVEKADGAGNTDIEGEKGGISDAFKRAAVKWGVGRYLYRLDSPWVELASDGKRIASHEYERLRGLLGGSDHSGKENEPSAQAVKIGDALKICKTPEELNNTREHYAKIFQGLHMVDKRYLGRVKETCIAALGGTNA